MLLPYAKARWRYVKVGEHHRWVRDGYYDDRDPRGIEIHWEWLLKKWTALADALEAFEHRNRP